MAGKNLKYFMRTEEDEIVTVPGPDSFRDENGEVINLEIRVLSQAEISNINKKYRTKKIATNKKGDPFAYNDKVLWMEEKDNEKATARIIVEALQYPDLKDKELMEFYKCVDVTEMPMKVFSRANEYAHVTRAVMVALGIMDGETEEAVVEEAKN